MMRIAGWALCAALALAAAGHAGGAAAEPDSLYERALALVNEDRIEHGLEPVALSKVGSAQDHADDMISLGYFSHWDSDGVKPYATYTLHGGAGMVVENIAEGDCAAGCSHEALVEDLHWSMMHDDARADWRHKHNIMDPAHTHANFGIAYDADRLVFVQHFEDNRAGWHGVRLLGDTLVMEGFLPDSRVDVITIHPDPDPAPLSADQLDGDEPYSLDYYWWEEPEGIIQEMLWGDWHYECDGASCLPQTTWRADTWGDGRIRIYADASAWLDAGGLHTAVVWLREDGGDYVPSSAITLDYLERLP